MRSAATRQNSFTSKGKPSVRANQRDLPAPWRKNKANSKTTERGRALYMSTITRTAVMRLPWRNLDDTDLERDPLVYERGETAQALLTVLDFNQQTPAHDR